MKGIGKPLLYIVLLGMLIWMLDQIGFVRLDSIPFFRKTIEQKTEEKRQKAQMTLDTRGQFCLTGGMWRDGFWENAQTQEYIGWVIKNRANKTERDVCEVFGGGESMLPFGYKRKKSYWATPEYVWGEAWGRSWGNPGLWSSYKRAEILATKIAPKTYSPPRPELECAIAYIRGNRKTWKEEPEALKVLQDPSQYTLVLTSGEAQFFCKKE